MSSTLDKFEDKILKIDDVLEIIPVSKATWYRLVKDNKELLEPIKIGRGSFWRRSSILKLVEKFENN